MSLQRRRCVLGSATLSYFKQTPQAVSYRASALRSIFLCGPQADVLGGGSAAEAAEDDPLRLQRSRLHPRVFAAARALKRRGVAEWVLAAVLSVSARTWIALALWLALWRAAIIHGWGAVFCARPPRPAVVLELPSRGRGLDFEND